MNSYKHRTPSRLASKHQEDRIRLVERPKRFHWRYVPGSRLALELAYDADDADDFETLPASMARRVRHKA